MNRGMTLIEVMVGLVTAVVIAGVCAKILQLGIMTYAYSVRQNTVLTSTRKAVAGDGAYSGVAWAGRGGSAFLGIASSSISVISSPASVVTSFFVAGGNLYRSKAATSVLQAGAVTSIGVNYYNMDASGLIMVSTAPESATLATALVTLQGNSSAQKTYALYSGAALRNHP